MGMLVFEVGKHRQRLRDLLATTRGVVRVASAYVTESDLLTHAGKRQIRLLTALKTIDIVSGATSLDALEALIRRGIECRFMPDVPRLHAKVYIFGDVSALVTSANLTISALDRNIEVGTVVDGDEVQALTTWFDEHWASATPLALSRLETLRQQTAELSLAFKFLRAKCHLVRRAAPHDAHRGKTTSPGRFDPSISYFLCNSNRPASVPLSTGGYDLEESMKEKGYAAAWETFNYPGHMKDVQRSDIVLLIANGAGIIAIGQAKGKCETLRRAGPRRVSNEFDFPEWRVPVDWLVWVSDDRAYPWRPTPRSTFVNISDFKYKSRCDPALQHLLGDLESQWRISIDGARRPPPPG
jgi:hypothetical protein